ncbi:MAG: hypothetical protein LBE16_09360, partial [Clostridiales Family XIII bacterium]|nr:hypothetical protein [Clostridiales Family XIII bacterium]
ELRTLDPTATVESCRERSIGEIRELTQEHAGGHHDDGDTAGADGNPQGGASSGTDRGSGHKGGHDLGL